MKEYFRLLCLLLWLCFAFVHQAGAQNNAFGINNLTYDYYLKAKNVVNGPICLAYADTMQREAVRLHDNKALILAHHARLDYYYSISDIKKLKAEMKKTQDLALKLHYTQYYFSSWERLIMIYNYGGQYHQALLELSHYQLEAVRMGAIYGMVQSYVLIGDVYFTQARINLAKENFLKALHFSIQNKNANGEQAMIYSKLAYCCGLLDDIKMAEQYGLMAEKVNDMDHQKLHIGTVLMNVYANLNRSDKMYHYKQEVDSIVNNRSISSATFILYISALIHQKLNEDNPNKAKELLELLQPFRKEGNMLVYRSFLRFYNKIQDYKAAFDITTEYMNIKDSVDEIFNYKMQVEAEALFYLAHLKAENSTAQLKHTVLRTKKMKSEKEMFLLNEQEDLMRLKHNKQLIASHELSLKEAIAKRKSQDEKVKRENERKARLKLETEASEKLHNAWLLALGLLSALTLGYLFYRRNAYLKVKHQKIMAINALKQARNADQRKTDFIQNISHEVRTPLNAIVGFNEILNGGDNIDISTHEHQTYLNLIRKNTELLSSIINDILDKSRLESGNSQMKYAEFDVNEVCLSAIEDFKYRAKKGVEIKYHPYPTSILIYSDQVRVKQIIHNYLSNALKYTDKGEIVLSIQLQKDYVVFAVTDTGVGVSPELAKFVFSDFTKASKFSQGTGLGLNIVSILTHKLGGAAWLDTTWTQGARFMFSLPLKH